jgi:hypothetical protein
MNRLAQHLRCVRPAVAGSPPVVAPGFCSSAEGFSIAGGNGGGAPPDRADGDGKDKDEDEAAKGEADPETEGKP